jgi:hypothetical protein
VSTTTRDALYETTPLPVPSSMVATRGTVVGKEDAHGDGD